MFRGLARRRSYRPSPRRLGGRRDRRHDQFLLVNFTLTLFVLGLVAAAVRIVRRRGERGPGLVSGALLDWFLFFSIGVAYAWNCVVHSVFGEFSAKVIGWPRARSSSRSRSPASDSPWSASWPSPGAPTCASSSPRSWA